MEVQPLSLLDALKALGLCILRTSRLLIQRRIHQPRNYVGVLVPFADGTTSSVYRETIVDRPASDTPVVLLVRFRLRWIHSQRTHAVFRWESELNTVLFVGFPGFVSKLWLRHDEHGYYRGIYEWDGEQHAGAYVRALWWALALVSEPKSIRYAIVPELHRDEFLRDPDHASTVALGPNGDWWRLASGNDRSE
ncbi:MAG: hypothetical protein ACREP9_20790 [Candidatus Dormibacteraceae bacterium]